MYLTARSPGSVDCHDAAGVFMMANCDSLASAPLWAYGNTFRQQPFPIALQVARHLARGAEILRAGRLVGGIPLLLDGVMFGPVRVRHAAPDMHALALAGGLDFLVQGRLPCVGRRVGLLQRRLVPGGQALLFFVERPFFGKQRMQLLLRLAERLRRLHVLHRFLRVAHHPLLHAGGHLHRVDVPIRFLDRRIDGGLILDVGLYGILRGLDLGHERIVAGVAGRRKGRHLGEGAGCGGLSRRFRREQQSEDDRNERRPDVNRAHGVLPSMRPAISRSGYRTRRSSRR